MKLLHTAYYYFINGKTIIFSLLSVTKQ